MGVFKIHIGSNTNTSTRLILLYHTYTHTNTHVTRRVFLVLLAYVSKGDNSIVPKILLKIQGLHAIGSRLKDGATRVRSLFPFEGTTPINKPHDHHLPHRAMKMEKKTVAGLSNRWLARAVPQAELRFQ